MAIYVLGISAFYHDSAAALLKDGEILAAAQEERFTRVKHDSGFPSNAVMYCLEAAGIRVADLNYAVFYEKPYAKFERLLETYLQFAPEGFRSFRQSVALWAKHRLRIKDEILEGLGESFRGELCFTDHHESHAASTFFPSPFEDAAVLTLDAVGGWGTSSIGMGCGNRLTLTHEMRFPHSLGMLYSAFTYYTGFKVNSGEYKMMGLAPYGRPIYAKLIMDNLLELRQDGSLWLDMSYFNFCQGLTMTSDKFHELFDGPPRKPESEITQKEMDIAASIQVVCEEIVLHAARHAYRLTGSRNLAMAGGVALNCVANGRVLREGPFRYLWIQPAAGDAGGALGAALLVWHHLLGRPRSVGRSDSQKGSLLGPSFTNEEIGLYLDSVGAVYDYVPDEEQLLTTVAELIAQEKVIGWFHGRMEYGPRALGSRSIIGDPRSPRMQQVMNVKIKFRESFRPFAPCVLKEFAHEIFELEEGQESPYMLLVAPVKEQWRRHLTEEERRRMQDPDLRIRVAVPRSTLPAITHVDYSARIQTVDAERHGRFYRLMRRFYDRTGCPVVINTSFNIRGEPIVCTPEDAFRCFMTTDMDCLILENFILMKTRQPEDSLNDVEAYKAQYALD
ncbi:MAG: carbamoyltransferase [Nitrospirota bacterium]